MHRMEKIFLYFTFTASIARTWETSKLFLKEVVKIANQSLPPEADFYMLDTQWRRWHFAKIILCGGKIEPVLVLEKEIIPFRLDFMDLAFNGLPVAPCQIHC